MRALGYAAVDRIVARWAGLRDLPASGPATRAEMEARLQEPIPWEGLPLEEVVERFWTDIEPFAGRIDHPRFFAFVPSSPTFASVLADWLSAGCNFFQGTWIESAGPSQAELVVIDWLKSCFRLPETAFGLLTSGGSAANLVGLATAREVKLGGLPAGGVAYGSDQTHSAAGRALRILGFPRERLRRIPTGADGRLPPEAVALAVAKDRAAGLTPFCVIANAGTTNTGAVDPLDALADLCEREQLWLHVDGAYGAFAALTVRGRRLLEGLERADSLVLDPHKWFYVGYEAGCLLVRDGAQLRSTFAVLPDYLQDTETLSGEVNFADYGLQLSRTTRALKLWFSLKTHGLASMIAAIDRTQHLAELAARKVQALPGLQLVSPASLGVICFRYVGTASEEDRGGLSEEALDTINERAVKRIQRESRYMLSSTRIAGRYVVRLCPMNYRTTEADVEGALREVMRAAEAEIGMRGKGGV